MTALFVAEGDIPSAMQVVITVVPSVTAAMLIVAVRMAKCTLEVEIPPPQQQAEREIAVIVKTVILLVPLVREAANLVPTP